MPSQQRQHALLRRQREAFNWSADESQVPLGIWCTIPEIHLIGLQVLSGISQFFRSVEYGQSRKEAEIKTPV